MMKEINTQNMSNHKLNRMSPWSLSILCVLGLSLVACPDPVTPDETERDMAPVEDAMNFTSDLEPIEEDMMVADMMPIEADMMESEEDLSCNSCQEDSDCGSGYLCVAFDEDGFDKRCFRPCEDEAEDDRCGDGFSCLTLSDELEICIAEESGSCELCYDPDGDGYGPGGFCPDGDIDCDSTNRRINPGRSDDCDGVDNNCNGETDEEFEPTDCSVGSCQAQSSCENGEEVECVPPTVLADDLSCDGQDDDCDGQLDEDFVFSTCGEGVCASRTYCFEGAETTCEPLEPSTTDDSVCDNVDDDCDGRVDENFIDSCGNGTCVRDAVCSAGVISCDPGTPDVNEIDNLCDNIDQDCDGNVDEGFTSEVTCGAGACVVTTSCTNGELSCVPLEPEVADDTSCDGIDNDCDGEIDEDCHVNTFRVAYNASASTASIAAIDVFYDQLYSSSRPGGAAEYQPTFIQIGLSFPEGMNKRNDLVTPGSSTVASGKTIIEASAAPVGTPSNVYYFSIYGTNQESSATTFPSSMPGGNNGHIVTLYFDRNQVAPPWTFAWYEPLTATAPPQTLYQYAPVLDADGNPTLDENGDPIEETVRRVLELSPIAPISP